MTVYARGLITSFAVVMLAGCHSNPLNLEIISGGGDKSITGAVAPLTSTSSLSTNKTGLNKNAAASGPSTLACTGAKAILWKLDASGAQISPALASVNVSSGSYTFPASQSLGVAYTSTGQISGSYLVEINGCNLSLRRLLTGIKAQDVTYGSSLVAFLVGTQNAAKVPVASTAQLSDLMTRLTDATSYATAFTLMNSDTQALSLFTSISGGQTPTVLNDAAPTMLSATTPATANEHDTVQLSVSVSHWRSDYVAQYLWQLDGQVIGQSSALSYVFNGNSQGARLITVLFGEDDGTGHLDQSKPYGTKTFPVTVANNVLPQSPALSVVGSTNLPTTTVPLRIATGLSLANCDSFSKLAVTENSAVAPTTDASFTITCSAQPTQDFNYILTTGVGTKTLRLWAKDAAGQVSLAPTSVTVTYSLVYPTIHVTSPATLIATPANVTISGTCDNTSGDVTVSGPLTGSPLVTPCSSGTFSRSVALTGADGSKVVAVTQTNIYGNTGTDSVTVTKDATAPTVVIASSASLNTNLAAIPITVTFSESVTGFTAAKVSAVNATISAFSGSGSSYTFNLVPTAQGSVTVSLAANAAADLAGNGSVASNSLAFVYDSIAPTVTIASTSISSTNLASIPVTVTFSESVTGFALSGVTVTNGTASGLTGSGTSYSFNVAPTAQGAITIVVAASAAHDVASNQNTASNSLPRTYDSIAPTVALTSTAADPTNVSPIPVTATFSESVTGLTAASFVITNGTLGSFAGSGTTYTFNVTPSANGTVTVALAAAKASDAAGNQNTAATSLTRVFNNVQPSLTLTSAATSPTKNSPIAVTATFSASVTGFTAAKITPTNGTVTGFAGSGTTYTFNLVPSGQGAVTAMVAANSAQDSATNGNLVSNTYSITYDTVAPTLTITAPASGSFVNLANQNALTVSGACSDNGRTVTVSIGAVNGTSACASNAYSAVIDAHTLSDGALSIQASQTDLAGNVGNSTATAVTKDTSVPTATLSGTPSSPSKVTTLNITVGGTGVSTYAYKIGASSLDCTVSSGYSADIAVATKITDSISAQADGSIKLCVTAKNAAGNSQPLASATTTTWVKDTVLTNYSGLAVSPSSPGKNTKPTVSGTTEASAIVAIYGQPACAGSVLGNVTAAANGTFSVAPSASIGADGAYNLTVLATDTAGNTLCSTSIGYTLDTVAPTVVVASTTTASTNVSPIPVTVTFSESVTGFTAAGVTPSNGTVSGFTGSGTTYNFNVTPTAQGAVTVSVTAGVASDAALNGNTLSNLLSRTYDNIAPVLTITSPTNNSYTSLGTVTLSGACETGISIVISGTGVTSPASTTCTSSAYSVAITMTAGDGAKNITLTQTDAASNVTNASLVVNKDTVAPTLTFASGGVQNQNTNTNTAVFSGACETGLTITVAGGVDSTTTTCAGSAWSYTTASQSTDATRTYTFKQIDLAGNTTTITGTWARDTVLPVVTITAPANGTAAQTSLTLTGACENGLAVNFGGAGALGAVAGTCTSGVYSQQIYFSASDGSKAITVSQTDLAGNVTTVTGTYTRDNTPPAITQTLRASPYYTNTNSTSFGGACENGSSIVVSGSDTSSTTCTSGAWTYTTASKTSDASYAYTFTQTDSAGNSGSIGATWIRKTTPPTFTFTSSSSFLTSSDTVTFAGTCVTGLTIAVSGSATASLTCSGGTWSYAPTNTTDAVYNYTFTETDQATNVSTLSGSWNRSTSGPILTITQTSPQISTGNSLTISGTCSGGTAGSNGVVTISGAVSTTTTCSSTNSTVGSFSYSAGKTTDGSYTYTFTTTDNFGTPRSTSASLVWKRDTTPPTMSAFTIAGGTNASTAVSYNPVSFSAADNISNVTMFCLKTDSTAPLAGDGCWYPVNGAATGVTPSNSLSISNYSFNVGITPQTYSVYLWLADGAGNISSNTATSGVDKVNITITPATPPTVGQVIVAGSTVPSNPPSSSDTTIAGGASAYIFWNAAAGSAALLNTPIRLFFTTDDVNWTEITTSSGIANAQGTGCTLISGATGCYKWSSPTTSFFRVRALATDGSSFTAQGSSPAANSGGLSVIAGNVDPGLGGSAKSAIFSNDLTGNARFADRSTFVVTSDGTVYFRDYQKGILKVDSATGKQTLFIATTGTASGDGGSALVATLKQPNFINIDFQNRLLILDFDRIRRVDLNQNPPTITTIAGGGGDSTSDTLANPLNLQFYSLGGTNERNTRMKSLFVVAPNNDIYFFSDNLYPSFPFPASNYRIRIYKGSQATPSIQSFYVSGNGTQGYPNVNIATCGNSNFGLAFDSSGVLQHFRYLLGGYFNAGNTACVALNTDSIGDIATQVNPSTGVSMANPTADPVGRTNHPLTGHNGVMYTFSRETGVIYKFTPDLSNATGGSFTLIAGVWGSPGSCADGTAALSCNITPIDVYVTAAGQIYFMDKGLLRTITSSNTIVTVMGQNFSYGDGGPATAARFALADSIDVHHVGGGTKVVMYDGVTSRIREFSVGGNIATIAGNGNSAWAGANSTPAISQPLTAIGNHPWDYITVDSATGDVFATYANTQIGRLVRSSGLWVNVFGGGSTDYSSGDGMTGSQVGFVSYGAALQPIVLGMDGSHVMVMLWETSNLTGYNSNAMLKLYSLSNYQQSHLMGVVTNQSSTTVCNVGSATSGCNVPAPNVGLAPRATYDSTNNRWLYTAIGWGNIQAYTPGGNRLNDLVSGLNPGIGTFAYDSSSNTVFYCGGGRLYKKVGAAAQVALSWPIATMNCTGYALIYDSTSNALYFPFTQNGLYGIGKYASP